MGRARDRASADLNGQEFILDADADTSISADTDDQIDIKIAGADDFAFKANTFEVQTGSNIDMNGTELILDADGDTSITADTDDTIDVKVGGSDKIRIDSSGRLLMGATTAESFAPSTTPQVQIEGTDHHTSSAAIIRNSVDNGQALLILGKSRGTSVGADTVVQDDDNVGEILFTAADGSDRTPQVASVRAAVDGTPGSNDMPGRLEFYTTADGSQTISERMRLDSNGNLGIGTTSINSGYRIHALNSSGGSGILAEATGTGNESYYQLKFVNSSGTSRNAMIKGDNGDSLRIASANAISIGMETSDSQALSIGTDGSLRLQHVYDDTTSNSANMYIHSDGTHQVMRSTSSERYKKDIETLEDKYADAVLGLRPVWYKSKCEADNPDHSHWGLIAEEVAKVDPRLVTFRYEITTSNNDQDTGETIIKTTKLDEPQAESVQYDRFVPHLINICKRQEDKITALEAEVKALKEA